MYVVLIAGMLAPILAGCGSNANAPVLSQVKGSVTLDGQPMPDGEVMFVVVGKHTAVMPVTNGTFTGQAAAGTNRVEVYSYKAGGDVVEMGGEKFGGEKENFIPAKYNANTTLSAEVTEDGGGDFVFPVTSK